jgi:hypothetical protein
MRRENTAGVVLSYGGGAFYVGMRRKKTPLNLKNLKMLKGSGLNLIKLLGAYLGA